MAPPNYVLYDIAQEILDAVVAGFTDAGVDLPTRRFVSNGAIADDCEQLAVRVLRIYQGLPEEETAQPDRMAGAGLRSIDIGVRLTRDCVPLPDDAQDVPSAEEIDANGRVLLIDGWLLRKVVVAAKKAGEILSACEDAFVGPCVSFGPQGGVGGWELGIRAQVGG